MADWPTVASLATAGGTLVLAGATFAAVRSANRAARTAERSLLAGLRPLLLPARLQDPPQKVMWQDQHFAHVPGGRAVAEEVDGVIYLAAAVRNAGQGVAILHGWYCFAGWRPGDNRPTPPDDFHRLTRDIYVAAGDVGFCQGAIRDANDPARSELLAAITGHEQLSLDLLYGDHEGGQRSIARFALAPIEDGYLFSLARQWNLDQPDPR
ncbi:MAG: hypothetical protein QOH74_58 [Gaiellales bacterium]|jgi:hypothetical protein|nr:hypothetical protein [Gaiellales bacterium]